MVTDDDDDNVHEVAAVAAGDNDDNNHGHRRVTYLVRDSYSEDGGSDGAATKKKSTASSEVVLIEDVLSPSEASRYLQMFSTEVPWNVEVDNFGQQTRQTCYFGDDSAVFSYVGLRLQPKPWPESLDRLRRIVEDACGRLSSSSSSSPPPPDHVLTACLANHYPAGEGHIPWHYDEVRAHGQQKIVASLSLGGPRRFQLRRRRSSSSSSRQCPGGVEIETTEDGNGVDSCDTVERSADVSDILLPSGSVLLMRGDVQSHYEHGLPLSTGTTTTTTTTTDNINDKECGGDVDNGNDNYAPLSSPHRISLTFRSIVPGYEDQMFQTAQDSCCT